MTDSRQLPSFNGWRAISILLVLGSHFAFIAGIPSFYGHLAAKIFDGMLGVRFFFTISGFLITWLMLKEEVEFGRVSLKRFYLRRALRILPVYIVCLMVMAFFQMTGISTQPGIIWVQLLTFTRNFYQTGANDFLISAHFWSLAVEEQFYLVWPVVFLLLARSPRKRVYVLAAMILFSLVCQTYALLGSYNRHLYFLFEENSTLLFLDSIAYGCLGAIFLDARAEPMRQFFQGHLAAIFLSALSLIILPEIIGLGSGLQALGFALLLLQSVLVSEFKPFRLLNHSWMVRIGILSYSLYIWQQLVYVLWPAARLWYLALPSIFVIAWISYAFLEKPFLSLRARFRTR